MIVVSDTTPLNYLVLINAIEVLPQLFHEVLVPPAVISELNRPKTPHLVRQWAKSTPLWLKIIAPSSRLPSTLTLDEGEAQALSLAKELHINDILIDERKARKIAQQEGLSPLPTLAILERASIQNLIDLPSAIRSLQQTNFRVPLDNLIAVLERDFLRKNKRS